MVRLQRESADWTIYPLLCELGREIRMGRVASRSMAFASRRSRDAAGNALRERPSPRSRLSTVDSNWNATLPAQAASTFSRSEWNDGETLGNPDSIKPLTSGFLLDETKGALGLTDNPLTSGKNRKGAIRRRRLPDGHKHDPTVPRGGPLPQDASLGRRQSGRCESPLSTRLPESSTQQAMQSFRAGQFPRCLARAADAARSLRAWPTLLGR